MPETTVQWEPARVRGNVRTAIAVFIEDSNGDLVDIEYHCEDEVRPTGEVALPWPAFDFSPDYATCCSDCGELVHNPALYAD